ncbi:MAG: thioredoxin-dependent thiol peroxidase [Microcoleaceae cyanobacterium]
MTLKPGDLAPDFSLPDAQGNIINLDALRGKRVILYFYPRDNTPGCTKEACGFQQKYAEYQSRDILVFGVSTDDAKSHTKFTQKYQLSFPLLSDIDAKVATAYSCYGLKKFMGKEYMGITRMTFVIDADGKIEKIYRKIKPELHAAEILADLPET